MWGDSLVLKQYSHRVDAEVKFYKYRFSILYLEVFWKQKKSTFSDDLQINMFKFVTGHGTQVSNMISIPNFDKRTVLRDDI